MPLSEEELIKRLRRGTSEVPAEVTPGPTDDPEAALIARLRADALTSKLIAPPTANNPRGQVLPTPGWDLGMSIANGMAQGWLPQIMGDLRARDADPSQHFTPFGIGRKPVGDLPEYQTEVDKLSSAREDYGNENRGKALVGELGGSLATAIPAMAAGAGALAPVGAAIKGAAPWAGGLVDFLAGASKVRELKAASRAVRGGIEGVESGAISSGLSDKPLEEQMKAGGLLGMLLGPFAGFAKDHVGSKINNTTADSAQALLSQGVPVRAGQIPGANKVTQGLDKVFGGGNAQQREAFGEKLTGYAGLPEKEVSQGWVAKNDQRVGKVMNDIQATYSIPQAEGALGMDFLTARANAASNLSPSNADKVGGFIDKLEAANARGINGNIYKNLTQKGGILDNMKADKDIANVVPKLREALDDAWGRALPTDKKAAWDQARREYKVTRVIDDSMGAAGAAEGVYNPKKLLKAVEDRFGNVENAGELGMLARGGQFLEQPGAAPASAKHGPVKTVSQLALAGAAGVAASEGSKVITHMGPEAIAALSQHPESFALPALLAMSLYGGAKGLNSALNGPRATQYLLDVSRGSRSPMLHGNNPFLPLLVEGYNRQ